MSLTQSAAPSASHLMAEGAASSASGPQPGTPALQPVGPVSDVGTETREAAAGRHRLEVHVDRVESILVITPVGDIDIVTGGLFLEALIAAVSAGESRIVVDLARVPFIDSTAVAIFTSADRALRAVGGQMRVVANAALLTVFRLAGLDAMVSLYTDVDAAVMSAPSSTIRPVIFGTRPAMERSTELLPAPLAPRMVTTCPASTVKENPRTAWVAP